MRRRARVVSVPVAALVAVVALAGCGDGDDGPSSEEPATTTTTASDAPATPSEPVDLAPRELVALLRDAVAERATADVELVAAPAGFPVDGSGTAGFGDASGPTLDVDLAFRTLEPDGTYVCEGGACTLDAPPELGAGTYPVAQENPWGGVFAGADPTYLATVIELFASDVVTRATAEDGVAHDVTLDAEPTLQAFGVDVDAIDPMQIPADVYTNVEVAADGRLATLRTDLGRWGTSIATFDRWR